MPSRISLITGEDRRHNITAALDAIADDVDLASVGQILVKPNLVGISNPLGVTHVDAIRAVLEWLRAHTDVPIIVGEGTAHSNTWHAFEIFGYLPLPDEYPDVTLMDLNSDAAVELTGLTVRLRPLSLEASRTAVQSPFRISIGPPKTHDTVRVTLSLKNMVMGGLISRLSPMDPQSGQANIGFWGHVVTAAESLYKAMPNLLRNRGRVMLAKELFIANVAPSSKTSMHQGFPAMNLNLFTLAPHLYAHLAVVDGFEAMEGNGPLNGSPVAWHTALASTDWLAADVTAARLMGFSLEEIGYLSYCAQANYGVSNPADIQIVGNARPDQVARRFKRHLTDEMQSHWQSSGASQYVRQALATASRD